jgi:uncharacterized protein (DUF302 family)
MLKPLTLALPLLALLAAGAPASAQDTGLTKRPSPYPVAETLERLEALLNEKGVKVFARIDHAAEAKAVGLALRPMQLLIFGNPKAGTPLMQAAPRIGLDLPVKVLAWQDDEGQTHVTWNSADYLATRHGLEASQAKPLAAIAGLIETATR